MNNELIERIARLEDDFSSQIGINLTGRANSTAYLISMQETLQDCKAALAQQQEAEPMGYLSDANSAALREGRNTRIYAEATPWVHRPVFLHPPAAQPARCEYCDGTGDVHSFDGEWLGSCAECLPAAQAVTINDAIAAGDGTLHGAIDYWQERALKAEAAQPQVPEGIVEKYNELLYHVARKFPNESRHETALRYIKNAESVESYCAAAKEEGK